jgi:hypothetical protein
VAGSTTTTHYTLGHVRKVVVDWVADAADATVPDTILPRIEGRLAELTTDPGATAPTNLYDLTLIDADGVDRLQGVGLNRATATTETAPVVYAGSTIHPPISLADVLTLKLAGNAVNSAVGKVTLIYVPA